MKINPANQSGSSATRVRNVKQPSAANKGSSAGNEASSNVNISAAAQQANSSGHAIGILMPVLIPIPGFQDMLKSMVDNPQKWMDYVKGYGTSQSATAAINEFLGSKEVNAMGQDKVKDILNSSLSQGKSPAHCMADVVSYELTLPQSYWNTVTDKYIANLEDITAAKLSCLQQCMALSGKSS